MAAYVIGDIELTDATVYEDYRRQVAATRLKSLKKFRKWSDLPISNLTTLRIQSLTLRTQLRARRRWDDRRVLDARRPQCGGRKRK